MTAETVIVKESKWFMGFISTNGKKIRGGEDGSSGSCNYWNIAQLSFKWRFFFVPFIISTLCFTFPRHSLLELLAETSRGHLIQPSVTVKPTRCFGYIDTVIASFTQQRIWGARLFGVHVLTAQSQHLLGVLTTSKLHNTCPGLSWASSGTTVAHM